jgi:DNA-binding transcriptional ArsR family regulator
LTSNDELRFHRFVTMNGEAAAMPVEGAEETDVSVAVALFRSLADPARLAILRHLTLGEHRVVDLTAHLGLAQSTTSAHLACLRGCGLVSVRTVGRSSVYSLAVESELMGVLSSAERLLAATGDAVSLCSANRVVAAPEPASR